MHVYINKLLFFIVSLLFIRSRKSSERKVVPGHEPKLHIADSLESPIHAAPPYMGGGFVQFWVLEVVLSPHETEHALHTEKSVQFPSVAVQWKW